MNKEEFKNNLNVEEVIERWDKRFGINQHPNYIKNSRNVSIAFEVYLHQLTNEQTVLDNNMQIVIYAVITRIFKGIENDMSVDYIIDNTQNIIRDFSVVWNGREKTHAHLFELIGVDIEAIFVAEYADSYKLPEIN